MITHHTLAATQSRHIGFRAEAEPLMTQERLPFTVRVVQSDADLAKAVQIRCAAYARHVPELAKTLRTPEAADHDSDAIVLLAESRLDGAPLGTARIQTNGHHPLSVEQSVELPDWLQGRYLAEVTRLGVDEGKVGRLVKLALVKASFMYCELKGIEWAIAAGRSPIDRQYQQLLFQDVFPEQGFIPMQHAGNLPHRVMAFEIESGPKRWEAANHPLLKFFRYTRHVDISVESAQRAPAPGSRVTRRLTTVFPGATSYARFAS